MTQTLTIEPTQGATLGARVTGLTLTQLGDETFKQIEDAWHVHGVLIFPEQFLNNEEQVAFSRRFGGLEKLITKTVADPNIGVLSNVHPSGKLIEPKGSYALFLLGNTFWHTDSSFKRVPSKASLLSARQVSSDGGETEWADMRAAYDALDDATKAEFEDVTAIHSYRYSQGLVGGVDVLSEEEWKALPPVEHPIIRTHPATGRKNLYIGRHASHIRGRDVEESRALLTRLTDEACKPPRVFSHRWSEGDIVIWDNRCVLHRGRTWPADQARTMARTTIAGDDETNEWTL